MGEKLIKVLAVAVTAMLLAGIMPMIPLTTAQYPGPVIYMEDPYGPGGQYKWDTETVPAKFNVTIWVTNVSKLMMFQVYITFNDDILNITQFHGLVTGKTDAVRAWPNDDLGGRAWDPEYVFYGGVGGSIGNPTYYHLGAGQGAVKWGDTLGAERTLDPDVAYKLACIEFRVTKMPDKGEILNCTLGIDNMDTYLYTAAGRIPDDIITKKDGYYELTWAQPAPPHCAVDPTLVEFGPWPPSAVGETFDLDVLIMDYHEAWGLTNATIAITYNTTLIDVVGGVANITLGPLWDPATSTIEIIHGVPDKIKFVVYPIDTIPSGDILVATIKFTVMYQPVYPEPDAQTDILFQDCILWNHMYQLPTDPSVPGKVMIYALISLPLPWFEVDPSLVELGPAPAVGEEFTVDVKIVELHFAWYLVAVQFRLTYDPELLEVVEVTEGDFLQDPCWNIHGTYFVSYIESDLMGPHVLVGQMLLPNATGYYDQTCWPNGTGTIATIKFKALKQGCFGQENLTCTLGLVSVFGQWAIDRNGAYIPIDEAKNVNGTYVMMPLTQVGRVIDVYGGAVNRGYGTAHGTNYKGIGVIWPAPFGGQGPNNPMDLVIPQSVVYLFANVTYNFWPVQSKDVGFEIEGPFDQETGEPRNTYFVMKYSNRTDENGVAWIKFQMPWPCENPEEYFGKYKVTVTVDICSVVVTDTLMFDYYYMVEITKVTTDKYCYAHCEYVEVTVEFRSKAMQRYPVLIFVVIQDELETHFGAAHIETWVEDAEFCTWKEYVVTLSIHIPKWAFAGVAKIYVSAFDKDPTLGGAPWCPTYEPLPEISIGPY